PEGKPSDVSATPKSSTSIEVTWKVYFLVEVGRITTIYGCSYEWLECTYRRLSNPYILGVQPPK
ncbi:hypothetical protein AC249_AIPGENE7140, partial [Exaiptasia diaphana]